MQNELYFNPKTLEREFGIAEKTQAKYRTEKSIPYSKIGGFVFYKKSDIYAWIDKHSIPMEVNIHE